MSNRKDLANGVVQSVSGNTIVLKTGYGQTMPDVPFKLTCTPPGELSTMGNSEIVNVTGRLEDTLTIKRAQNGTTQKDIGENWIVANAIYTSDKTTSDNVDFTTYSTSEQKVGTWIDGKTIYRRTFTGTITADATSVVGTSLIVSGAPFSQLIRGYGTWRKNAVEHVVFSGGWGGTNIAAIDWNQSSGNVQILSSSDTARTNAPYQVTLEYTKP